MKQKLERMYIDWFNNFLTLDGFASYYGITIKKAERIIKIGRLINHRSKAAK